MEQTIKLEDLKGIVYEAGKLFRFDREVGVISKGYANYVTEIDYAVQKYMKEVLSERYPFADLMSEESTHVPDRTRPVFILDPVDGTTNLIRHLYFSNVSLGVVIGGSSVIGIVYNPFTGEMFTAEKGKGAYVNGEPIHVSDKKTLRDSLVCIGTSPYRKDNFDANMKLVSEIFRGCVDIRRTGSSALDLCYVACGRFDAFAESWLRPWDFAAGLLICREADGTVTDWKGNDPDAFGDLDVVASNSLIHGELLEITRGLNIL